jgi:DNA-binding Xre family transcriptional regulator
MSIKELINKRGYTIMMLADRIGVSRITMSKYINNINEMPLGSFIKLCDILKYPLEDVISYSKTQDKKGQTKLSKINNYKQIEEILNKLTKRTKSKFTGEQIGRVCILDTLLLITQPGYGSKLRYDTLQFYVDKLIESEFTKYITYKKLHDYMWEQYQLLSYNISRLDNCHLTTLSLIQAVNIDFLETAETLRNLDPKADNKDKLIQISSVSEKYIADNMERIQLALVNATAVIRDFYVTTIIIDLIGTVCKLDMSNSYTPYITIIKDILKLWNANIDDYHSFTEKYNCTKKISNLKKLSYDDFFIDQDTLKKSNQLATIELPSIDIEIQSLLTKGMSCNG